MQYLILLDGSEPGNGYDVTVPDLPGCTSAGDTMAEALANAQEAILGHLNIMVEDGEPIPQQSDEAPSDLAPRQMLALVDIDLNKLTLSSKTVRLNVTIPERTVALIDHAAKRAGTSRSAFLTQAALTYMERQARIG